MLQRYKQYLTKKRDILKYLSKSYNFFYFIEVSNFRMFAGDIEANKETLRAELEGRSVLVIGGAGTIGASYIRAVLPFRPSKLVVVDISEKRKKENFRKM